MAQWLAAARPDLRFPQHGEQPDVFIAYCPERVLPGKVMVELLENDRVIGGMTPAVRRAPASCIAFSCAASVETTRAPQRCKD